MYAIKIWKLHSKIKTVLKASFIHQNHPRKFYVTEKDQGINREKSIKRDLFITHL